MGGGLEADLSAGAVRELWYGAATSNKEAGYEPVLQVAQVTDLPDDGTGIRAVPTYRRCPYRLLLSDGVHSQHALLASSALIFVSVGGRGRDGLRRGSVVRLVHFFQASVPGLHHHHHHARTVLIHKLEILQTECALIGSLKFYEPTRNSRVSTKLSSVTLSEKPPVWKLVADIKDDNLGYSDKPHLITVKATISRVTELLCHVACPLVSNGKRCNAKATADVDRTWRCNKCRYWFFKPCNYGCSVRIKIQDHTGTTSATTNEDTVEEILGCSAEDLYSYKAHAHAKLDDIILGAVGKQFVFQLKVELKRLSRKKCIVLKAEKVDPSAESPCLLGRINTLMQGEGSGPGSEHHSANMLTITG